MSPARGPRDRRPSAGAGHPGGGRRPGQPGRTGRTSSGAGTRPAPRSATSGAGSRPSAVADGLAGVRNAPAHVRRMITLVLLLVLMTVIIAPVLSGYLRQQADITSAQQQITQEKAEISALETELAKWDNPAYVEQQARQRLRFVKEGEVSFTVIDDTGTEYTEALPGMAPLSDEVVDTSPWYGQVWESVKIANEGLPETVEP